MDTESRECDCSFQTKEEGMSEVTSCHSAKCTATFLAGKGMVPDLATLYEQGRSSKVDLQHPLSASEVLSMEFCRSCSKDRLFEKFAIGMYETGRTLRLMEQWAEKNAQDLTVRIESQHSYEWRQQEKLRARVIERLERHGGEDLPPTGINRIFAEAKPHREHHKKPGKRYANLGRAKKAQQNEAPAKKGKGKNKDKGR